MVLKADWVNGEVVADSDLNAVATQVNTNTSAIAAVPYKTVAPSGSTTGATDHAAITAAIGTGNVNVVLAPGTFYVNAPIILQNHTTLEGAGMYATTIQLANSVNQSVIKNYVSPDGIIANAEFCTVRNLSIYGNKANQSAGHGIEFNTNPTGSKATNDSEFDTHQLVENVNINNCKQDGYHADGRSSMVLYNVYTEWCDGKGFHPAVDTHLTNCVASSSGHEGFYLNATSIQLVGCKAFYNGQVSSSDGIGFYIYFSTAGAVLAGCVAQDNKSHGFALLSSQSATLVGCISDSNSTAGVSSYVGLDMWDTQGTAISIACQEGKRDGSHSNQQTALQLRGGSAGNSIDLTHRAASGATIGVAVSADSVLTGNRVVVNGTTVHDAAETCTTTTASASAVNLTAASTRTQICTGTTTQDYYLAQTAIIQGKTFCFINLSTGAVTVHSNSGGTITTLTTGQSATVLANIATPNVAGDWSIVAKNF